MISLTTPLTSEAIEQLHAGDSVLLTGTVYTARDAAHARLIELINQGQKLPIDIQGQIIYYVGPTPSRPGQVIGSAGPTTSGRMDMYTPTLLTHGLKAMIGKGARNQSVRDALAETKGVYFAATGGAAAMLAKRVVSCEVVAYDDLGCEAIRRLEVKDLPLVVINDCHGHDFYEESIAKWKK